MAGPETSRASPPGFSPRRTQSSVGVEGTAGASQIRFSRLQPEGPGYRQRRAERRPCGRAWLVGCFGSDGDEDFARHHVASSSARTRPPHRATSNAPRLSRSGRSGDRPRSTQERVPRRCIGVAPVAILCRARHLVPAHPLHAGYHAIVLPSSSRIVPARCGARQRPHLRAHRSSPGSHPLPLRPDLRPARSSRP